MIICQSQQVVRVAVRDSTIGSVTSRAICNAVHWLSFTDHAACMMRIAMRA